ncbi:MAG: DUF1109 domain-containing protein [Rhizobacter sp.]|nr:DUF1109 domain-containing protein [Rhizobacter sp.]
MKTDALIAMLAQGPVAVRARAVARRVLAAIAVGVAVALVAMLATLHLRADLPTAVHAPMFWLKLAVPLAVAALAVATVRRLARPGGRAGRAVPTGAVLLVVLAIWAVADVVVAPSGQRAALVLGNTALPCVVLVAVLSLPMLATLFVALRSLAPTRLRAAGTAAGALAGGLGAAVYALHCNEMTLPFVAVWYVLGMSIPAALGALLGRRWLRWP